MRRLVQIEYKRQKIMNALIMKSLYAGGRGFIQVDSTYSELQGSPDDLMRMKAM